MVDAEGQSIALFNVDGTFCAIDNTCTHVGGPLGEGDIDGEIVPVPGTGLDLTSKRVSSPIHRPVVTYAVFLSKLKETMSSSNSIEIPGICGYLYTFWLLLTLNPADLKWEM